MSFRMVVSDEMNECSVVKLACTICTTKHKHKHKVQLAVTTFAGRHLPISPHLRLSHATCHYLLSGIAGRPTARVSQ